MKCVIEGSRGVILPVVLWVSAGLALLAFSIDSHARQAVRTSRRLMDQLRERRLCLAAVELAGGVMGGSAPSGNHPEIFNSIEYPEGVLSFSRETEKEPVYGLEDEQGRLNLNSTPAEILSALPGMTPATAEAVTDWRDADDLTSPSGAENREYKARGRPYPCKNGPLQSVPEMLLILGMGPEVFKKVSPFVTVYGDGRVNLNSAPRAVLSALGFSNSGVEAILRFRRGRDGREGTADDGFFETPAAARDGQIFSTEDRDLLSRLISRRILSVRSSVFRVHLSLRNHRGEDSRYEIVVSRGAGRTPVKVFHLERI
jgi:general secretion pathway protein K